MTQSEVDVFSELNNYLSKGTSSILKISGIVYGIGLQTI